MLKGYCTDSKWSSYLHLKILSNKVTIFITFYENGDAPPYIQIALQGQERENKVKRRNNTRQQDGEYRILDFGATNKPSQEKK